MSNSYMTINERRAVIALATIMSLRMVGLFMVIPIFTLYASQLNHATPFLIGLAMGIYGLFQATFQIPLGALSDRIGRKPIICAGLTLFIFGSIWAAFATSITSLIFARALQGAGAIGGTLLATIADLTRIDQRTKAMAIAGVTIGFSFLLALLIGPLLLKWLPTADLFLIAGGLSLCAMGILFKLVPTPAPIIQHHKPEDHSLWDVLSSPELVKLNSGIFILHAIFTASFIVVPITLSHEAAIAPKEQWPLYLGALSFAFILSLIGIGLAERKQQVKSFFLAAILILALAELLFLNGARNAVSATLSLGLFFTGFSLLEAFLPSLISRAAPVSRKGTALGVYSCSQFLGIFTGGLLGGWLYGSFNAPSVYFICITLTLIWLAIACMMQPQSVPTKNELTF